MKRSQCGITEAMRAAMKFGAAVLLIAVFATIAHGQTTFVCCNGGGGGGTVTNVAATVPAYMTVTGSPITNTGTLAFDFASAAQNLVFAAPCSATGAPTFRVLCSDDIPTLAATKVAGTAIIASDARLSDARTPTPHASTHAAAGSDPVTLTEAQITNLTTDLAGKQATGNYITATTGDVVATGPGSVAATIQANAVALGTDTTGGYAASATEGGSATTADALAANGTNCSAGFYSRGVDASGNAENCTAEPAGGSPAGSGSELQFRSGAGTLGAVTGSSVSGAAVSLAGKAVIKGAGTAATSMFEVQDTNGRVAFKVNENGTVTIDADPSTGLTPLTVKFNGATIATVGFNGDVGGKTLSASNSTGTVLDIGSGFLSLAGTGVIGQGKWTNAGPVFGGASYIDGMFAESITLSTSGSTTDSGANLLPANSVIEAVMCRVTTTIATATDWSVGDSTTAARFSSANSTLTSGTTSVGLNHQKGGVLTDAAGPTQTAAASLRITTTGIPSAGVVRCVTKWRQFIAPTS